MKTNNRGTKQNIVRLVAMLLIVVGVLTALPASAFAGWTYKIFNRADAVPADPVKGTPGKGTVQFKYFAEDIYVESEGGYTYYEYDPTAKSNYYIADATQGVKDPALLGTLETYTVDVTKGTASYDASVLSATSAKHCLCSHSPPGWLGDTCDHENPDLNVTFSVQGYGISYPLVDDIIISNLFGEKLFSSSAYTYSVNAKSLQTISESKTVYNTPITVSYSIEIPNAEGYELFVTVNYNITVMAAKAGDPAVVDGEDCGWYDKKFLGSTTHCYEPLYTYSATASITPSATYTVYVRKNEKTFEAVSKDGITQVKANPDSATDNGVLYSISGISTGDVVTLPSYDTLKAAIPVVSASGEADDLRNLYKNLLYPIGYYTRTDTDIANGSRGTAIKLPLTMENEETVTIWIEWAVKNPDTSGKDNFNSDIATNTGTITVTGTSIGSDFAYIPDYYTNSEGTSGALALTSPTIAGTLNLAINYNGSAATNVNAGNGTNIKPTFADNKANSSVAGSMTVPVEDNVRDFTIVLQQDTTVTGKMEIGGHTGSISNGDGSPQGFIIGNYVALDLNGYTLYVADGAALHSYGYIYDSVGTGKIVVEPGGTMYTQMVLLGWHGGTSSFKSYATGFSPFEDYYFPYMHTTVEIKTISTTVNETTVNKSGRLIGFTMLYATSLEASFINLYLPVFGEVADEPLFSTSAKNKNGSGSITMKTSLLSKDMFSSNYTKIHNNGIDIKNEIIFQDLVVTFSSPTAEVRNTGGSITLDFKRTRFPISSMLDTTFCACDVTISQQIMVMPGSTLTVDEKSVLTLGYEDKEPTELKGGTKVVGVDTDTRRLAGGIFALPYVCNNAQTSFNSAKSGLAFGTSYSNYWDAFHTATVNIYGVLAFQEGNHEEYVLSGNINISSFRIGSDTYDWTLDNLTEERVQSVSFRTYGSITALASTNGDVKVRHYYSVPLNSNGTWYVVDSSVTSTSSTAATYTYVGAMVGSYDVDTGLFEKTRGIGGYGADGYTKYIIDAQPYTDNIGDGLPGTDVGLLQSENEILEFQPIILGVTENEGSSELVTASNGKTYVYYAGTYHPVKTVNDDGTVVIDGSYFITGTADKILELSNSMWVIKP